jgi:hypothetical protein
MVRNITNMSFRHHMHFIHDNYGTEHNQLEPEAWAHLAIVCLDGHEHDFAEVKVMCRL